MDIHHAQQVFNDKKQPVSKLKPLKYREIRMRGYTEKRIQGNADLLLVSNVRKGNEKERPRQMPERKIGFKVEGRTDEVAKRSEEKQLINILKREL